MFCSPTKKIYLFLKNSFNRHTTFWFLLLLLLLRESPIESKNQDQLLIDRSIVYLSLSLFRPFFVCIKEAEKGPVVSRLPYYSRVRQDSFIHFIFILQVTRIRCCLCLKINNKRGAGFVINDTWMLLLLLLLLLSMMMMMISTAINISALLIYLFFSRSRSFSYSLCVRVVVPVYILYIDRIEWFLVFFYFYYFALRPGQIKKRKDRIDVCFCLYPSISHSLLLAAVRSLFFF